MTEEQKPGCCCSASRSTNRTDEEKRELTNRLNRISGQINGIKKMIVEDRYCDDILVQLSAVDHSIKSLANVMLDRHMHSCVKRELEAGNEQVLDEIVDLFRRFQ